MKYTPQELELKKTLKTLLQSGRTYEQIAQKYGSYRTLVWKMIHRNYMPRDAATRRKFGLDVKSEIRAIGEVQSRAQALRSVVCKKCNQAFIPNNHQRQYCYDCRPYRKKKRDLFDFSEQELLYMLEHRKEV